MIQKQEQTSMSLRVLARTLQETKDLIVGAGEGAGE
jgi:hypothetical protein